VARPPILIPLIAGLALVGTSLACGAGAPVAQEPAPVAIDATEAPAEPMQEMPLSTRPALSFVVTPHVDRPPEGFLPTAQPPQAAITESRRLVLEYPPRLRAGDSDVIRLSLEIDPQGNLTPTAEIAGHEVTGETVAIPDLYDTHSVIAEARIDIAGVEVRPSEVISEPLARGQSVTFYWSIRPAEAGTYRGTVWLHLRYVDIASGAVSRKTLSAQVIQIEATNFLGLSGGFARGTGTLGSLVGAVLGFPFVGDVLRLFLRARKKS